MSLYKNTASQKWIVFAFNVTDNEPLAGDAANITGNLRLDGGVADAIDDVNPTELEDGYYAFDLTQAETNADLILIAPASSTASIKVIGVPGAQYTTPITLAAINAECDTAITDAALATAANLATVDTNVDAILVDSNDLQTNQGSWLTATGFNTVVPPSVAQFNARTRLDADYFSWATDTVATVTTLTGHTAQTGDSFAIVNGASGSVATKTVVDAIPTTAMRGTDSAYTGTPPTAAAVADAVWDELQSAHVTVGSFGIIASEIAAIPTTAMRGTDSAATAASLATAQLDLDTITGTDGVTLATAQALYAPNTVVPPSVAQFNARTRLDADYFSWATDAVATVTTVGTTTTNTDMRGTDSANTVVPDAAGVAPTAAEIMAAGDVDGFTLEEAMKLCLAGLAGKLSGAAGVTVTIQAADDSKARITATVDSDGNRSAVTLDAAG